MPCNILADECVDFRIVRKLREHGFSVHSVLEECPSIPDPQVFELAKSYRAILLTEDSDFGRWVFAHKQKEVGVIFLRYTPHELHKIIFALIHVLRMYQGKLVRKFVVISTNKIRIRDI